MRFVRGWLDSGIGAAYMAWMRVHLLGVAGAGMAPLAGLLHQSGLEVSGSDTAFDPPMGPRVAGWGVRTFVGTDPSHLDGLDPQHDVVVVGNVCRRDHPLVLAAQGRGLRLMSMPTALRELVFVTPWGGRPVVVVAGTHGKTTTSALLASLLTQAGMEPGFLIGGIPVATASSPFAIGRSTRSLTAATSLAPFVIEGDEYDSAFFEKVPKVWGYAPRAAILTSIEHDHVDIYPDAASYVRAFAGLLERLPPESEGGLLVANAADPAVVRVVHETNPRCRVVYYAASDVSGRPYPSGELSGVLPVWTASEVGLTGQGDRLQPIDLFVGPSSAGRYRLGVFGVHNIANALAALTLAVEAFGPPLRELASHLALFRGTERRAQQVLAPPASSITLYDDFAHHPTAVLATLRALRQRHAKGRLIALYEPRSATACRAIHQHAYANAFGPADIVLLAPLGRTTIPPSERLDLVGLATSLRATGKHVELPPTIETLGDLAISLAEPGDVLVTMTNGAFGGVTARLAHALATKAFDPPLHAGAIPDTGARDG